MPYFIVIIIICVVVVESLLLIVIYIHIYTFALLCQYEIIIRVATNKKWPPIQCIRCYKFVCLWNALFQLYKGFPVIHDADRGTVCSWVLSVSKGCIEGTCMKLESSKIMICLYSVFILAIKLISWWINHDIRHYKTPSTNYQLCGIAFRDL